jgi:hypothetical protein
MYHSSFWFFFFLPVAYWSYSIDRKVTTSTKPEKQSVEQPCKETIAQVNHALLHISTEQTHTYLINL